MHDVHTSAVCAVKGCGIVLFVNGDGCILITRRNRDASFVGYVSISPPLVRHFGTNSKIDWSSELAFDVGGFG
jgi:hypothetical protein